MKTQIKIIDPYTIRHRYQKNNGQMSEWSRGTGQFLGWETIHNQVKMICIGKKNRSIEFEITYKGKNYDLHGQETEQTFVI